MIEGQADLNRAMDGDRVLVKLDVPTKWKYLDKPMNMVQGQSKYTNTQVVEKRVVDEGILDKSIEEDDEIPMMVMGPNSDGDSDEINDSGSWFSSSEGSKKKPKRVYFVRDPNEKKDVTKKKEKKRILFDSPDAEPLKPDYE